MSSFLAPQTDLEVNIKRERARALYSLTLCSPFRHPGAIKPYPEITREPDHMVRDETVNNDRILNSIAPVIPFIILHLGTRGNIRKMLQIRSIFYFALCSTCFKARIRPRTYPVTLHVQRAALGLTLRFCLFLSRSSSCNIFLAWLHSSCSMAHQPVELSRKLFTKPCV